MEVKKFYKTQREIAHVINTLIDGYWDNQITEPLMINTVIDLYKNNPSKIIKNGHFTTIIKQQCGKRRLEVLRNILL